MNRFCPVCGKATDELVDNFCKDCFLKERDPVTLPERMETRICRGCLKHQRQGRWTYLSGDFEEVIERAASREVMKSLKTRDLQKPEVEVLVGHGKETSPTTVSVPVELKVSGVLKGVEVSAEVETTVVVRAELCPNCARQSGSYYEAVIQIRGPGGAGVDPGILEKIKEAIDLMVDGYGQEDPRGFITDIKELKEGVDYYLGSKKMARKIVRNLKTSYGGEMKETASLVGQRDGKGLYRSTILLRLPKV
jgi:nonsense-mediated mRNA decay protein 3